MNKKVIALIAVIAIVAILGVCLVACNAKSYQNKLEKKGYTVSNYTGDDDDDIEWGISASKGALLNGDSVTVVKFKELDDAKEKETWYKNHKDNGLISYEVYRTGKIVIVGTAQGVKDAK